LVIGARMFLKVSPFSRINDHWTRNPELYKFFKEISKDFSYVNFDDRYDINTADGELFQSAFLHVVTETVFYYPNIFLSEKSFKPIINKRPFLLVASAGCLENLKNFGFKTFNDYWDESYDTIEDADKRMLAICEIIQTICSKSIIELRDMTQSMSEILEFNFDHYQNSFKEQELKKFEEACVQNLKVR